MWTAFTAFVLALIPQLDLPTPSARLEGRVLTSSGAAPAQPVAVTVAMRKDDGNYQQLNARSAADGRWSLETEPGWKVIEVWARGKGHGPGHVVLERLLKEGDNGPIDVPLTRGASIAGRVLDKATGRAVVGARVWADNWEFREDGDTPAMRTDAEGRFELIGVEERSTYEAGPGHVHFDLHADGPDHAPYRQDLAGFPRQEAGRYALDLTLVPFNCEINGVVNFAETGEPCYSAMVALIDELGQYRVTTSGAGGVFRFERIAAGRAQLWSWPIHSQPSQPRPLLFGTDSVPVNPGDNASVIWLESCAGTRVIGKADALPGAEGLRPVLVLRRGLGRESLTVHFEEQRFPLATDGSFEANDLLPGRYQAELVFPEGQSGLVEPRMLDFELEQGRSSAPLELRYAQGSIFAGRFEAAQQDLRFSTLEYSPLERESWTSLMLEPDGRFRTPPVWPGKWRLRVRHQGWPGPELTVGPESALDLVLKPKP
jgi:hypothetical protein